MKAKNPQNKGGEREHEDRDLEDRVHEDDDDELARAREILERTMRFLTRCSEDPEAAVQSEDPRELIRGLRDLATPLPPAASEELPTIPIRKRRSA